MRYQERPATYNPGSPPANSYKIPATATNIKAGPINNNPVLIPTTQRLSDKNPPNIQFVHSNVPLQGSL